MQSSLHSKEITTATVEAVSFGFFNDEEVRWASARGCNGRRTGRGACSARPMATASVASVHRHPCAHFALAVTPAWLRLQVRKISVKRIVAPMIFDNMKTAVRGGLYDPALGPMDPKARCVALLLAVAPVLGLLHSYVASSGQLSHVDLVILCCAVFQTRG